MIPVVWAIFLCPQLCSFQPDKFTIKRIKHSSYIKVKKKGQSQIAHQVFLCSATFSVFKCFIQGSGAYQEALLLALCDGLFYANLKISYRNIIVDQIRYFSLDSSTHYLCMVLCLSKMNMYETTERKAVH